LGFQSTFAYDPLNRLAYRTDAAGTSVSILTRFVYDISSNMIGSVDPRGVGTSFAYDPLNRLAARIDAATYPTGLAALNHASPITTYTYDIGSNLIGITDPRGVGTSLAYTAPRRVGPGPRARPPHPPGRSPPPPPRPRAPCRP